MVSAARLFLCCVEAAWIAASLVLSEEAESDSAVRSTFFEDVGYPPLNPINPTP